MPADSAITALGWQMLDQLPPIVRDDPTIRAIIHVQAREAERRQATIAEVRDQLFPQRATIGLQFWEAMLGIEPNPAGQSYTERGQTVLGYLSAVRNSGRGRDWEAAVTRFIGSNSWSYEEYDPDNPTASPPPDTIRVTLPYTPGSAGYHQAVAFIRAISPAKDDFIFTFSGGLLLDASLLDQDTL